MTATSPLMTADHLTASVPRPRHHNYLPDFSTSESSSRSASHLNSEVVLPCFPPAEESSEAQTLPWSLLRDPSSTDCGTSDEPQFGACVVYPSVSSRRRPGWRNGLICRGPAASPDKSTAGAISDSTDCCSRVESSCLALYSG